MTRQIIEVTCDICREVFVPDIIKNKSFETSALRHICLAIQGVAGEWKAIDICPACHEAIQQTMFSRNLRVEGEHE